MWLNCWNLERAKQNPTRVYGKYTEIEIYFNVFFFSYKCQQILHRLRGQLPHEWQRFSPVAGFCRSTKVICTTGKTLTHKCSMRCLCCKLVQLQGLEFPDIFIFLLTISQPIQTDSFLSPIIWYSASAHNKNNIYPFWMIRCHHVDEVCFDLPSCAWARTLHTLVWTKGDSILLEIIWRFSLCFFPLLLFIRNLICHLVRRMTPKSKKCSLQSTGQTGLIKLWLHTVSSMK